ncbi:MAG: hypothetical protein JXC85_06490 [Candidatus Aenigmarchaeota archaeon]|nr:hypothetical protein [Candidatus Aenigmarchaeota archaeon]
MGVFISPNQLQIAHYYFFCMAVVSFSSAIIFYFEPLFSYIFLTFYVIHSGISWHIALFLHRRLKEIYVITSMKYFSYHFVLTAWSSCLTIVFWHVFRNEFSAMASSLIIINYFLIFVAIFWLMLARIGFVQQLFEWYDSRKASKLSAMVLRLREKVGAKLVTDDDILDYRYGSDEKIDYLLHDMKRLRRPWGSGGREKLYLSLRDFEIAIWDIKIGRLNGKMDELRSREGISAQELIKTYARLIESYRKKRMKYEKRFFGEFGK